MSGKISRNEVLVLALLSAWVVISRLPFKAHYLFNWDAVQYALALDKYDIAAHQPHPPGYFLYIMLGKAINLFVKSHINSYFIVGVFCSVITIIFLYLLAKDFTGKRSIGYFTSFLFSLNYIFWESGEYPNSYISEVTGVVIVAFLLFRYFKYNKYTYLYVGSLMLGLIGGFRQNSAVFLLPLFFFIIIYRKTPASKAIASLIICGSGAMMWFIPMIVLSGGLQNYFAQTTEMATFYVSKTSIFSGAGIRALLNNAVKMFKWITISLNIMIFPILYLFFTEPSKNRFGFLKNDGALFLLSWLSFPVFFYLFFHLSKPGYLFTFLPAIYLLVGVGVQRLFQINYQAKQRSQVLQAFVALTSISILFSFTYFYNDGYLPMVKNDTFMKATIAKIRKFKPDDSLVVISQNIENPNPFFAKWRHIMYYLPDYHVYRLGGSDPFFGNNNISYKRTFKKLARNQLDIYPKAKRLLYLTDDRDEVRYRKSLNAKVVKLPFSRRIITFSVSKINRQGGQAFVFGHL